MNTEQQIGCPKCGAPGFKGTCEYCGTIAKTDESKVKVERVHEQKNGELPAYLRMDEDGVMRFAPIVTDEETEEPVYHNYEDSIATDLEGRDGQILIAGTDSQKLTATRNGDDRTVTFRMEILTDKGQAAVDDYQRTSVALDEFPTGFMRIHPMNERVGSGIAPREYAKNPFFRFYRKISGVGLLPEDFESGNFFEVQPDKLVIESISLDLSGGRQETLHDLVSTSASLMGRLE